MASVTIKDTTQKHLKHFKDKLRERDYKELLSLGIPVDESISLAVKLALFRKTAYVGCKIAAIWGVIGTPLSFNGSCYLLTTPECEKVSAFKFTKIYLEQVKQMNKLFPQLSALVDASYTDACRLIKLAGFEQKEEVEVNGNKFIRFLRTEDIS